LTSDLTRARAERVTIRVGRAPCYALSRDHDATHRVFLAT